jgi:Ca2+-binding EF-hand superfamily protein
MVLPAAQPWEFSLVDKIFQKGGDGAGGIARYLARHVRSSDYTPPGAILNVDFRRAIAELNVAVTPASYDAVAATCGITSNTAPGDFLSVRLLSQRLASLAATGVGISSVYAPVGDSPLTGVTIPRVALEVHNRALKGMRIGGPNDPDYDPPQRGQPSSPRAPAAKSDPNSCMYDVDALIEAENRAAAEDAAATRAKSKENNGLYSISSVFGGAHAEESTPHKFGDRREAPAHTPASETAPYADENTHATPRRIAQREWERRRAEDSAAGAVAAVGVPPIPELPYDHQCKPMASLNSVEKVEEAMRTSLMARISVNGGDTIGRAMRILSGMSAAGGRVNRKQGIRLHEFHDAMKRVNVNPADPRIVEELFKKHDADGNGTLDYDEFVRYLLPQDFMPTSPKEYRKQYNYRGFAPKIGEMVPGGGDGGITQVKGGADEETYDKNGDQSWHVNDRIWHGEVQTAGMKTPRGYRVLPERGIQRPSMEQDKVGTAMFQKRDSRMHDMIPDDAARPGKTTAGDINVVLYDDHVGQHNLSVRHIEAAMIEKLAGANGGDATPQALHKHFKYFDVDLDGVITRADLRKAILRLNVDPTDDAFEALCAKYDPTNSGFVDYATLAHEIVKDSAQSRSVVEASRGGMGERWGADGKDTWAGYDRGKLQSHLEAMQEPGVFDRGKAGEAGYVPKITTAEELERLLTQKAIEKLSATGFSGAMNAWKYFDRDGSGGVDRDEFETALSHFNIAATKEVIDEVFNKYDKSGDGDLDYFEMLEALVPSHAIDTVQYIKRLDGNEDRSRAKSHRQAATEGRDIGSARVTAVNDGSQRMTVKQFQKKLVGWMSARGSGLVKLRAMFKYLDTDGNGKVSHAEFAKGLHRMNIHPRHEDMVKILKHYDANEDGEIDFEGFFKTLIPEQDNAGFVDGNWQWDAYHDPKPANIVPTSHMLYGNGLEKMLMEKIEQLMDGKGSMIKVFRELDWDRSGTVDPREFRAWLNRLNFHPDDETFERTWKSFDPEGKGHLVYQDFVSRVVPKTKFGGLE